MALRLVNWRMVVFGDEAWHYFAARYFGEPQGTILPLGGSQPESLGRLVWWRPLFVLILAPGAAISFDAWRLLHLLIVSLLPPLAFRLARAAGTGRIAAATAGLVVLLHPVIHRWSGIVFADALMTTAFAFGLWFWLRGRVGLAVVGFLASLWIKESALPAVAFVALWHVVREWRRADFNKTPLVRAARTLSVPLTLPLGLVPLYVYLQSGGQTPGWTLGGDPASAWNLVLMPWLYLPLLVGLVWPRTRGLCGVALASPAFYYAYARWGHHIVEQWYAVMPGFLALVASSVVLDEAWKRSRARPLAVGRAVQVTAAVLVALLAVQIAVPDSFPAKRDLVQSSAAIPGWSILQAMELENARERALPDLLRQLDDEDTVFLVDFAWFSRYHPFSENHERVLWAYTAGAQDRERWREAIEQEADATILFHWFGPGHGPFYEEVQRAYAACITYENADYVLIRGQRCPGAWSR